MALGGWKSPRMLKRYVNLGPTHLTQSLEGLVKNSNFQIQNVTNSVTKTEVEK